MNTEPTNKHHSHKKASGASAGSGFGRQSTINQHSIISISVATSESISKHHEHQRQLGICFGWYQPHSAAWTEISMLRFNWTWLPGHSSGSLLRFPSADTAMRSQTWFWCEAGLLPPNLKPETLNRCQEVPGWHDGHHSAGRWFSCEQGGNLDQSQPFEVRHAALTRYTRRP